MDSWSTLGAIGVFTASVFASGHVILWKRDSRAAISWVGLIWLAPGLGALLYFLLGINRLRRRAERLREEARLEGPEPAPCATSESDARVERSDALAALVQLGEKVSRRALTEGNRIEPLENGDAAYPPMLEAIEQARASITLCSYIFDTDAVGMRFVRALAGAVRRGVEVRVLIDAVGARYSLPPIHWRLEREKVPVALFLPPLRATSLAFFNLRTHRKLLVIDGALAFTGGMNIRAGHLLSDGPSHPVRDVHFRLRGPVVAQLQEVFANDWCFTTQETLAGPSFFPELDACGRAFARVITDGPDDDFEVLRTLILGAIACAQRSVRIVTPYFLPDSSMISALGIAALRGVRVDIVLPSASNLRVVQWASTALLWQLLKPGCKIHLSPPPFDHTKLLVVDEHYLLLGSTNWDPRSLRLNFELNVECYDPELAAAADALTQARIAQSRELTLDDVDGRSLPIRLRDGLARLLSPYL